jgi:hypothetical protein
MIRGPAVKKLLFLMILGFVAAVFLKGKVGTTPDNQGHFAGWATPNSAAGSPLKDEASANPASFGEQLNASAKTLRGTQ